MAKGKDGAATKGGKGAKVSKQLRKAGDAAVTLVQQPVISELVAAALTAAAASLAQTKTAKTAARETADAAEGAVKETAAIGAAVKRALLDAARSMLDSFDDPAPAEKTLARSEPAPSAAAPAGNPAKPGGTKAKGGRGKKKRVSA